MRGAVLAGGASSRFGHRPKGLETVGGHRLLDRVVDVTHDATGAWPLLVANDTGAADWRPGLEVVPDLIPGAGSLGGIYTALCAGSDAVLIVAWDMPLLTAGLLQGLIEGAQEYDAFLPESPGPRGVEPLCAVYRPSCAEPILRCIERGALHSTAFHDTVRVGRMPLAAVARYGAPAELFLNVNHRDDLEAARTVWRERHGA